MKRRLAIWAVIGLAVACCWVIAGVFLVPHYNLGRSTLVAITAPVSFLGRGMSLSFYWFIVLNAATYVIAGLAAEGLARAARALST